MSTETKTPQKIIQFQVISDPENFKYGSIFALTETGIIATGNFSPHTTQIAWKKIHESQAKKTEPTEQQE